MLRMACPTVGPDGHFVEASSLVPDTWLRSHMSWVQGLLASGAIVDDGIVPDPPPMPVSALQAGAVPTAAYRAANPGYPQVLDASARIESSRSMEG